jgi:hypothetical protein
MVGMSPLNQPVKRGGLSSGEVCSVRSEVEAVIASAAFAASKRCQDFLRLVVEHALAGRFDSLKERMIGAEMFGRPVDYDTSNDAVVRVRATEVRKRLAQYYSGVATPPTVRIELPQGSYLPSFHWETSEESAGPDAEPKLMTLGLMTLAAAPSALERNGETEAQAPSRGTAPRRPRRLVAAALAAMALVVAIGLTAWLRWFHANPGIHSIAILPLQNLSGDPNQEYFAEGMTEELIAALGQVSALKVISRTSTSVYKGAKKACLKSPANWGSRGSWKDR